MTVSTIDGAELDFGQVIDQWSRRGTPAGATVALYNALNSESASTRAAAGRFLSANTIGLGDPSNPGDVAAQQKVVAAAQRLAGQLHVAPPSASLRRMYLPSDVALNERLDRASIPAGPKTTVRDDAINDAAIRDTSPRRLDFANGRIDDIDMSNAADRPVNDGRPVGYQPRPGERRFGYIQPSIDTSDW